jgi:hypothetical protein
VTGLFRRACVRVGLWLSLVERLVRDEEAVGSNPTSPIKFMLVLLILLVLFSFPITVTSKSMSMIDRYARVTARK